jgi:hypothetical protein
MEKNSLSTQIPSLLFPISLWLAFVLSSFGTTVEIPVTPASLDTDSYLFSVSTNVTGSGTAFHVTMTAKTGDVETNDSGVGLQLVAHTKQNGGLLVSCDPLKSSIVVQLKKEKRVWTADFVVPDGFLDNPNLCLSFGFLAHSVVNGKVIPMPSATRYEIRLADFTGRMSALLNGRWQTESGDTYEFTGNKYVHWLENPAISKSGQADAAEPTNRIGMFQGEFSIDGNFLVLSKNGGASLTNRFYLTKGEVEKVTGKFFGTGYSFIIISGQSISKYELMYR